MFVTDILHKIIMSPLLVQPRGHNNKIAECDWGMMVTWPLVAPRPEGKRLSINILSEDWEWDCCRSRWGLL